MLNRVCLQGRFCAEPELRMTSNGLAVVATRLAVDRPYKKDIQDQNCDFINVTFWRKKAEFVHGYFRKGDMIIVEGYLRTRDYTDKDGKKRYITEVVVENANFAGSKRRDEAPYDGGSFATAPQQEFTELPDDDGDLPF